MSYEEAIGFLYMRLPMFTRDGSSAFKKDLINTLKLCAFLNNPHQRVKSVHIAGTNGKGSTSHMLAAILQQAGYKTGLYTSPHLLDFRERIRINGAMVPQEDVVDFVQGMQQFIEEIQPSFFEVTVAMAFDYFAREEVDIAIIETGLGGRLDSTNVISPLLSVITNIGYDHMNLLGDTLQEIAEEKAGIIKYGIPVVVSERQTEVEYIFTQRAKETSSHLMFASDVWQLRAAGNQDNYLQVTAKRKTAEEIHHYTLDLKGSYQLKNLPGVLTAIDVLRKQGFEIHQHDIETALKQVQQLTGLMGRWQTLATNPLIICDTGHNEDGWREVLSNISAEPYHRLHMVLGVMRDKNLDKMLPMLPKEAAYYFCHADMPRALPAEVLKEKAMEYGLLGKHYPTVADALETAKKEASSADLVFVGGSTFIVGEALKVDVDTH